MARDIQEYLKERMPEWRETHPGVEELRVAVMGCVVNGPGESKARRHRDQPARHVRGAGRARLRRREASTTRSAATGSWRAFIALLEDYVARRFPSPQGVATN